MLRYKFDPRSKDDPKGRRGFTLLADEKVMAVNAMLRLSNIKFDCAPRRTLRPAAAPPPGTYMRGGAVLGGVAGGVQEPGAVGEAVATPHHYH